jgi:hypothetical protein
MARPHEIVRKKDLHKYIPYQKTQIDEIIDRGQLEVVKLSANGRAIGITMRSIVKYQTEIMGLEPLADDRPEKAPISNQSATAPQLRSTNDRQPSRPRAAR